MLASEQDPQLIYECLSILNAFLIAMPESTDVFTMHRGQLDAAMGSILSRKYQPHLKDQGDRASDMVLRLGRNLLTNKVITAFNVPPKCLMRQRDIELVASLVELTGGQCCDEHLIAKLFEVMLRPSNVSEGCLAQVITSLSKVAASQALLQHCDQSIFLQYLRYPNDRFKIAACRLIAHSGATD